MKKANKNDEELRSLLHCKSTEGAIKACKKCSAIDCCGVVKEGGEVEPPYLTQYDIAQIEFFTGLKKEQFANVKRNPVTKKPLYLLRTNQDSGCIFFNADEGKCRIYSLRPIDCRLFPFDVEIVGNEYYWAFFKYKKCSDNVDAEDMRSLHLFKKRALMIFGDELRNYATQPVPGMQKVGYELLERIEL